MEKGLFGAAVVQMKNFSNLRNFYDPFGIMPLGLFFCEFTECAMEGVGWKLFLPFWPMMFTWLIIMIKIRDLFSLIWWWVGEAFDA